jgi:hypothetical protein
MKRIESLTPEQLARFPEFIERWTKIGLCTEPADRPRAEAAVALAYKRAGMDAPHVVWCGSPLSQGLTRAVVLSMKDAPNIGDSVWASGYGQHDANWIGFYDYFREVCGLTEQTAKLDGLTEICHSAGWFLPHTKLCWISERHSAMARNERGQLHREDGPALEYQDGWQLWRLRGVAVDEQIVMAPQTQTIEQLRGEKNEEVKRLRIERFGWPKYLAGINATRIDKRRNDIEGTRESLYRADGASVLVCACPSTGKLFALECPPNTETCEQAQNYLSSGLSSRIISAA